jgi:KEOPS complex subunit Cgi121
MGCTGKIESPEDLIEKAKEHISEENLILQFMDADLILGKEHIQSAIEHAQRAFERNDNISTSMAMEILIYCACDPQIKGALARIGLKKGCERIALVFDDRLDIESLLADFDLKRDDSVLDFTESKLRGFGIDDCEITALEKKKLKDLVLERIALVDVIK